MCEYDETLLTSSDQSWNQGWWAPRKRLDMTRIGTDSSASMSLCTRALHDGVRRDNTSMISSLNWLGEILARLAVVLVRQLQE